MVPLTGGKKLILLILCLEFLNYWIVFFFHFPTDLHLFLVPSKCHSDVCKKNPI